MTNYLGQIEKMGEIIIDMFDSMIRYAEVHKLTNEQSFLEIMDLMNKLSVKH